MTYHPAPLDTSSVELTPELRALSELLAKHVHDVWARNRLEGGWTLGPARDDSRRRHPSLVPYELLPESEKQLDRDSAVETLKLIVALGFRIEPPQA